SLDIRLPLHESRPTFRALPRPSGDDGPMGHVAPGSGWPGDPATPQTPVARSAAGVRRLAAGSRDLLTLDARSSVCRACPRLVARSEEHTSELQSREKL